MKKILYVLLLCCIPAFINAQPLTANIKVNGTPTSSYNVCWGDYITLDGSPSGGNLPYIKHQWTGGAGQISPDTTQVTTFAATTLGTYTVTYVVTDNLGNTATDNIIIKVVPLPDLFVPLDQTICMGSCVDLNAWSTTASGITWYQDHVGGTIVSKCAGCLSLTIHVCPTDTITRYWALAYDTLAGCTKAKLVYVRAIKIKATASANPNPVCLFDTTQLKTVVTGNGNAPYSYSWSPNTNISNTAISNPLAWPTTTTTYTVTVTDKNNCTTTASVTVNVPPPPVVHQSTTVCFGGCATLTATGSGTIFVWNTGQSGPIITPCPIVTTTYIVTMTDAQGCTSSASAKVTVNPKVIADAGPAAVVCNGLCVGVGGAPTGSGGTSPYTYHWSPGGSSLANPSVCPAISTMYHVTVTDALGCTGVDTVFVTVNPKPTAATHTDTTVCHGVCLDIGGNPTATGGTPGYTYDWSPATGLSAMNIPDPQACTSATTTYSVTVTDAKGCTDNAAITVTVNPKVIADAGPDKNVCPGFCVSIGGSPTGSGGSSPYTYNWSPGGSTLANPSVCPTVNTMYHVTVTDAIGCIDVDSVLVSMFPLPPVDAGNDTSICIGATIKLCATGGVSYQWSNGIVNCSFISPLSTTTYTVTATDANGCTASDDITVTVNPLPTPTLNGSDSACINTPGNIYVTDSGMTNYIWTIPATGTITNGGGLGDSTVTITWTSIGTQSLCVNYTDPNGCAANSPTCFSVIVSPLPNPSITGPDTVCLSSTGNTYDTQSGMSNYNWTVSTGDIITSGLGTSSITVIFGALGNQTVSVTYTDPNACQPPSPVTYNVWVNPLPFPTISGPDTVCADNPGYTWYTESGMFNYSWTVSGGAQVVSGGGPTDDFATVIWTITGADSVSVSYTDSNGCTALPTYYNIWVNPSPTPVINGPSNVCSNSTGNIYFTQASNTGYVWTVTSGLITGGGGPADTSVTVTWNIVGPQTVSVNYNNSFGCPAPTPTIYNVTVNPLPVPTLTGHDSVCYNVPGNVYTTDAGMSGYVWTLSSGAIITAGGTGTDNTITITWTTAGTDTACVNYSDGNGCTAASSTCFNVTVSPLPVPTITGNDVVCQDSTSNVYCTEAGMTGYIWNVSAGGTITGGLGTNCITVDWTIVGMQNVSVNYTDPNGCTAASPTVFDVTVNSLPVPTITGPANTCINVPGYVYVTDPGMSNYIWVVSAGGSISGGGTTTDNTITITWTATGTQTVSVNYDNAFGCDALTPYIYNVTVNPLPTPTITGNAAACYNVPGNIYTTEPGMSNYLWTIPLAGGTITAGGTVTDNSATITWTGVGSQTVCVNYSDANGCTAVAPICQTVIVSPLPVPTITGNLVVCQDSTGNVYCTEAGMTAYIWNVSSGGTITGGLGTNCITVDWTIVGMQNVSVNYTDPNGCTAVDSTVLNVIVNPLPTPTITGHSNVCYNSTANVYSTETGMSNYVWIANNGIITGGAGTDSITVTWNTVGPQTVSVNYDNSFGCDALAPTVYDVTVNALPVPTLSGPASTCYNITGNVYTTDAGMSNYIWTISSESGTITAGGTNTDNSVTVTWTITGLQTVCVNYNDANGCTAALPTCLDVTVNALPVPTITGADTICATPGNIYFTEAGMSIYNWTITGGTITNGIGTENITVDWSTVAGDQTLCVNYVDGNGCTAVSPTCLNVFVYPLPIISVTGTTAICAGTPGNIYCTETGMTGYAWTVSAGGTITAGAGTNCITVTWNTAGTQNVAVNYVDTNGCSAAMPFVYDVLINPLPVPVINGSSSVCIHSTGNIYTAQTGKTNYLWTVAPDGNIAAGGTTTDNTITITWNTSGSKTIKVNFTDVNGCTATAPTVYNVMVNPLPIPVITGSITSCNLSTDNDYTTEVGMTGYTWEITAGGKITTGQGTNSITVTWNIAGPQTVSVSYTDANGCTAAAPTDFNLTVYPLPDIVTSSVGVSSCAACDGMLTANDNGGAPISTYLWSNSETTTSIIGLCPGTYNITVTADNGCDIIRSADVKSSNYVEPLIFYNTFSPNGDGINDQWTIKKLELYPDNQLTVVNRWGNEVYSVNNYKNDWNGSNLIEGTYFYIFKVKMCNEDNTYKGYITIVR